jgi:Holliday junction resolvase RusA-like endonuclease
MTALADIPAPKIETIDFVVLGLAAPAGSKRAFRHNQTGRIMVTDASKRSKPWQALVAAAGYEAMAHRDLLTGPLDVQIAFYQPRPKTHYGTGRNAGHVRSSAPAFPTGRPDVLKLARGVEDALTGVCWRDDAQIIREAISKRYGEPARAEIAIEPISERDTMTRAP